MFVVLEYGGRRHPPVTHNFVTHRVPGVRKERSLDQSPFAVSCSMNVCFLACISLSLARRCAKSGID